MPYRKRALIVAENVLLCATFSPDFEFILTVKVETRHPVGEPFGCEFSAFVIISELRRSEVARPGNFI